MKKGLLVVVGLVLVLGLVVIIVLQNNTNEGNLVKFLTIEESPQESFKENTGETNQENDGEAEIVIPETGVKIDPSLIAHWTFDTDANDEIKNYQGSMVGGASILPGKRGNALSLDGVDDYVKFSDEALEKVGSLAQGSISFWFNYESILEGQTVMPIFYIGNKHENPDNMFVIEIGHSAGDGSTKNPDPNDKKIYSTWIKDNKEPFLCFDSGENMKENIWHHYVVVVGPDGNQGYIDGRLMENTDHNFGDSNEQIFLDSFQGKELFLIGYGRSSFMISPDFVYYKGMIDDLRIYNRPLEWIEVQKLYNSD